jgi:hypothetical protein
MRSMCPFIGAHLVVIWVACRAHKLTQAVGVVIPTICMQMHVTFTFRNFSTF